MNFIVKLSSATNAITDHIYDSILIVIEKITKYSIMISCNEAMNARILSRIFLIEIISRFDCPTSIISDRNKLFVSSF